MKFASKMPITKGWSGERKYRVTDATGTNYLLRETELGQKARKESECLHHASDRRLFLLYHAKFRTYFR